MVKTTINIPDELWTDFLVIVLKERGGRKANKVITELIEKYVRQQLLVEKAFVKLRKKNGGSER